MRAETRADEWERGAWTDLTTAQGLVIRLVDTCPAYDRTVRLAKICGLLNAEIADLAERREMAQTPSELVHYRRYPWDKV